MSTVDFGSLKHIMFWSDSFDPNNYTWHSDRILPSDVDRVVNFLKAGTLHNVQRGKAQCRIKGSLHWLGNADRHNGPFNYPDQCWYYIEEYGVWTPELDEVLNYIRLQETQFNNRVVSIQVSEEVTSERPNLDDLIKSNPPRPKVDSAIYPAIEIERVNGYQVRNKNTGHIRYLPSLEGINTRDLNLDIAAVTMLQITEGKSVRYAMEVTFVTPDQFLREQLLTTLTPEQQRLLFDVK